MATYYIDFNGGNDSNDGLSFANRRKSLPIEISRESTNHYNSIVGNEYRIMGMPATNMGINATWEVGQTNRFKFVGRERGYHGMNIGALTVGGIPNNSKEFKNILSSLY